MFTDILYITTNGLGEPLGRSQIFSYLKKNASEFNFHLISLEKKRFLSQESEIDLLTECSKLSISWKFGYFISKPYFLSTLINMLRIFYFSVITLISKKDISIIHCRSYIPAFIGLLLAKIFNKKLIFDMRGLWIEELIASGSVKKGGILHKLLRFFERLTLKSSSHIITLTNSSKTYLVENQKVAIDKISVIPTCVDLDVFYPSLQHNSRNTIKFVVLGTILSGWFKLDHLAKFIRSIDNSNTNVEFDIITTENCDQIKDALELEGIEISNLKLNIFSKRREELAEVLQNQDFGLMFYESKYLSEIARSPTKIGELLACGIPIIINSGIGDIDNLIQEKQIGIKIDDLDNIEESLNQLLALRQDNNLKQRCIQTAHEVYSVTKGSEAYSQIYKDLKNNSL